MLTDGAAFNPLSFSINTVEDNEQAARVLMSKDIESTKAKQSRK